MKAARTRFALLRTAILPLCGLAFAGSTAAQEGPIVFGEREKQPYFKLFDTRAWAEFRYRQFKNDIDPKNQPSTSFREDRFEETFTLETGGYIYHPNLVELNLAGTFGLRQDTQDNNGDKEDRDGFIYDYDLNATILRKEVAPVTLYTRRSEDVVNRQFGPSLDHTLSQTGAIWDIRSKNVPTRIEIFHSDEEESGFGTEEGNFR
jgi:hypothetical protein